jgi:AcrR family transcriptional regulator
MKRGTVSRYADDVGSTDREPLPLGRPRSEAARQAVLHAVDDLLVEIGYAAMTMKGIAERAGVGRQTVYRWWSNKAEILLEACVDDARSELTVPERTDPGRALVDYLKALTEFLTVSPAGLAYRALLGEAQHDPAVRELLRAVDVLADPTRTVLDRVRPVARCMPEVRLATTQLYGPVLAHVLTTGTGLPDKMLTAHASLLLQGWGVTTATMSLHARRSRTAETAGYASGPLRSGRTRGGG